MDARSSGVSMVTGVCNIHTCKFLLSTTCNILPSFPLPPPSLLPLPPPSLTGHVLRLLDTLDSALSHLPSPVTFALSQLAGGWGHINIAHVCTHCRHTPSYHGYTLTPILKWPHNKTMITRCDISSNGFATSSNRLHPVQFPVIACATSGNELHPAHFPVIACTDIVDVCIILFACVHIFMCIQYHFQHVISSYLFAVIDHLHNLCFGHRSLGYICIDHLCMHQCSM